MRMMRRYSRDFYGGLLMILIGAGAGVTAAHYPIGTLADMGPGFYPLAIGILLALVGLAIAIAGGLSQGASGPRRKIDRRGGFCIIAGTLAFAVLGVYGGLVPATFAIVFISALGDRNNSLLQAFLLAAAMVVIAVLVFWWALQVQLPLFNWG